MTIDVGGRRVVPGLIDSHIHMVRAGLRWKELVRWNEVASLDGAPARLESQRPTRDEALAMYTSGSAWFSGEEDDRGNLGPGSHADLAVLSSDFFTVEAAAIPTIESELTMVGGEIVHAAEWVTGPPR